MDITNRDVGVLTDIINSEEENGASRYREDITNLRQEESPNSVIRIIDGIKQKTDKDLYRIAATVTINNSECKTSKFGGIKVNVVFQINIFRFCDIDNASIN